jgi:uncharacterized protein YjbI with pentapeptide repeats
MGETIMSIEKKSLISTLRTTKKANIVKDELGENPASASQAVKQANVKQANVKQANVKQANVKQANVKQANVKQATVRNW